jgi:hypothetical protein
MEATVPSPASTRSTVGLVALAWALGVTGVFWAYLLAFASAMNTVPAMELGTMLLTLPLPLAASVAAGMVVRRVRGGRVSRRFLWGAVPALLLGALGLFIGFSAYFDMT